MADFSRQWSEYRRLRNNALLLLGLTAALVAGSLLAHQEILLGAIAIAGGAIFVSAIVIAIRVHKWRCPRCGQAFIGKWSSEFAVLVADKCAHCGLRKWMSG
jgi:predicted RNA-binding Zn-ribbon protein involved in translation (DUF1610 family)